MLFASRIVGFVKSKIISSTDLIFAPTFGSDSKSILSKFIDLAYVRSRTVIFEDHKLAKSRSISMVGRAVVFLC
jgi:hypothetical protein